ncbi:DUF1433 domain-containing protein [Bacillus atrophaeus]|uniref:DUF1433 domain-containing protein n=1 Tax=Bacillus atrophaeus TaxID=1452 RepID=UPI00227F5660|nr:DUF1433 domain-containing protein [Bacillus atrophaeus]MCY7948677.1 DUF1433 domain-containing protein [Bacillus atrophaeus]MCY8098384.1 DUF1433 domain-containing protein [Bacillus atrophaeus]MCY9169917.1 DUF1433 domain-containing protein [Bacillus atrophaeus]MEC0740642.1 DUF1433 domain-containing protein [Bacillus atrophaeus]MEC0747094.1 DUF1433 domain-containing protein [Bacillus atrophaeus]
MKHEHDEKKKEQSLVSDAHVQIKSYLEASYKDIKDVEFSEEYKIDPTGSVQISGHLNNDSSKKFNVIYDPPNKEVVASMVDAEEK